MYDVDIKTVDSRIHFNALAFSGLKYSELQYIFEHPESLGQMMYVKLPDRYVPLGVVGHRSIKALCSCKYPIPHSNTINDNLKRWTGLKITTEDLRLNYILMLLKSDVPLFSVSKIYLNDKDKRSYLKKVFKVSPERLKLKIRWKPKNMSELTYGFHFILHEKDLDKKVLLNQFKRYVPKKYQRTDIPYYFIVKKFDKWEFEHLVRDKKQPPNVSRIIVGLFELAPDCYLISKPQFEFADGPFS